jgi:hypothetical protein
MVERFTSMAKGSWIREEEALTRLRMARRQASVCLQSSASGDGAGEGIQPAAAGEDGDGGRR